jgi:hypothetical protein
LDTVWSQADRIKAKPLGDACLHQFDDAADGCLRIIRSGRAEVRHRALTNAMGIDDDPALRGLPEHFVSRTTGMRPM